MPALVIKQLPVAIYKSLKRNAALHRRSMTQEAIETLEQGLRIARPIPRIAPYRTAIPLTDEFIHRAKREGRA